MRPLPHKAVSLGSLKASHRAPSRKSAVRLGGGGEHYIRKREAWASQPILRLRHTVAEPFQEVLEMSGFESLREIVSPPVLTTLRLT